MSTRRGIIAIMGSGETTDSMVRVHRYLLQRLTPHVKAVFIDTPAGFQMNADDLFEKTREYFEKRLGQTMDPVAFKSSKDISPYEAEKALHVLRQSDYIFVGPGSPTYALKNWSGTPIPQIIFERVQSGACFIAASAAALTLGMFTLPVYEIYKVGDELHWVPGLNLLGRFGLDIVVIPHWNNAEGGTHDTRFCYMGEPRLTRLEEMLPEEIPLLGIDEHTACILDFEEGKIIIRGIGGVTLRHREKQKIFTDGQVVPLEEFKRWAIPHNIEKRPAPLQTLATQPAPESFLDQVKILKESFEKHLHNHQGASLLDVLVTLDKMIWKSCRDFEDEEMISQARETFRGMIVQLGLRFDESPKDVSSILSPLMDILLDMRSRLRVAKEWEIADEIRGKLLQMGVILEDTSQGTRWQLKA
ncbi:MAG: Type 1 glutamine amidotransferase-like domain-containing protein [Thermodesulfobacteriota bacterium]|nr:Type 1 glutamine amidotransferase-like domain-containing protein [Thermodesulfobacteriota bacterium]